MATNFERNEALASEDDTDSQTDMAMLSEADEQNLSAVAELLSMDAIARILSEVTFGFPSLIFSLEL